MVSGALRPAVVTAINDRYLERLLPANVESRVADPSRQLQVLNTKIDNLGAAIEHGGQIAALVERFAERQKERSKPRCRRKLHTGAGFSPALRSSTAESSCAVLASPTGFEPVFWP